MSKFSRFEYATAYACIKSASREQASGFIHPWTAVKTARCLRTAGRDMILWQVAEEEADDSFFHLTPDGVIVMDLVTIS